MNRQAALYSVLVAILASFVNAFAGPTPTQQGTAFGNTAVAPGGILSTAFGNATSGVNDLNSGASAGLVQPSGSTVQNLQNDGVAGNANGTGLGSFGTANVTRCAGYVQGSGGVTQDAECGAVNFASQHNNINAQANAAYNLNPSSSMFTNALALQKVAAANINTLLPGTSTTNTTSQKCSTTPASTQYATESCFIYNQLNSSQVTTTGPGPNNIVTCNGGATISSLSCIVTPATPTTTATCDAAVPVVEHCQDIASANVVASTGTCVSGKYTVYDNGVEWGGLIPTYWTHPAIGSVNVVCTGQKTFNLVVNVTVGSESLSPNGPWPFEYGASGATSSNISGVVALNVSWDGTSVFQFGGSNGWGAWNGIATIPIGSGQSFTVTPTYSDGCAAYGDTSNTPTTPTCVANSGTSFNCATLTASQYATYGIPPGSTGTGTFGTSCPGGSYGTPSITYNGGCSAPTPTCVATSSGTAACSSVAGQYGIPSANTVGTANYSVSCPGGSYGTQSITYNGGCSTPCTTTSGTDACSSVAGQYSIPPNQIFGTASYTNSSCSGIAYTGGCSATPSCTASSVNQVQLAYIAYLGRPADPAGLAYFVCQPIATVETALAGSAEFANKYAGMSVSQQVNQYYLNGAGVNADTTGLTYWVNQVNTGAVTLQALPGILVTDVINAGPSNPYYNDLQTILTNAVNTTQP